MSNTLTPRGLRSLPGRINLLSLVAAYRTRQKLRRTHDWVADHYMGLVFVVFLGIVAPVGLICLLLGLSPLISQALMAVFFLGLGLLIGIGGLRNQRKPDAAAVADQEYTRQRQRAKLRRQHTGLRKVPDSMLDDLFRL